MWVLPDVMSRTWLTDTGPPGSGLPPQRRPGRRLSLWSIGVVAYCSERDRRAAAASGNETTTSEKNVHVNDDYPVRFSVDYPARELNRLQTAFRVFTVIPIAIVFASIGGYSSGGDFGGGSATTTTIAVGGTGLLFLPLLLMIVFRQKYPRWWFDWNLELLRFTNRVGVYVALMDDRYPSTDDQQSVHLDFGFPDAKLGLNRWLPLVKWFLAIPHYIVLVFLYVGVLFAVIGAWFAILVTGRYPRGLFDFVEGVIRWHNRVVGYALILVTDRYPPFRLRP